MADVIWTLAAFRVLETMPQATAFGIIRLNDYLREFPEMGSPILKPRHLSKYRQMIYKKTYRTIYRFDKEENCVRILHLHNCRQKFPTTKQIKKALEDEGELSLD